MNLNKQFNLFDGENPIRQVTVEKQRDETIIQSTLIEDTNPRVSMEKAREVVTSIYKLWQTIEYNAKFEDMLEIILLVLEQKNEEYLERIKGVKKEVLNTYSRILAELTSFYTMEFYYDDILGRFYQRYFSRGRGGDYYTPWNVALLMAEILNPKPNDTLCEPAVGSGVMLLAAKYVIHKNYGWQEASKYGRKICAMDISSVAIQMCKIQIYLTDYLYMRDLFIISAFQACKEVAKRKKEASDVHK